jgi:hypothetical protein
MNGERPPPDWRSAPRGLWVALAAGGSALVAATWLVAQLSWQSRLRALEAEVDMLRRTRQVDLPQLLIDLRRVAGPAAERLALEQLRERHALLERDHKAALAALTALRRSRRLEDRFTLPVGSSKALLAGKVRLALEGVEAGTARVSLAGAPASLWRPGDYRDLNFGGGLYRLSLEPLAAGLGNKATFRLDALLDSGTALPPRPERPPGPTGSSALP